MSDSSPYRRYVVFQVEVGPSGPGVAWHARAFGAAEGLHFLEARIAEEYLDRGKIPLVALVDCTEGRVIAASHVVGDPAPVVRWGRQCAHREPVAQEAAPPDPPAVPAAPDDEEDEDDRAARLRRELVDGVVDSFLAGAVDERLLEQLQQELEVSGEAFEFDGEAAIPAVHRDRVAGQLEVVEVSDVRAHLDIADDEPVTLDDWVRYVSEYLIPFQLEDADISDCFDKLRLTDSLGRSVVLVKSIRGYSFSGVEVFWYGLRRSWEEFAAEIEEGEWFTCPEDFDNLPVTSKRAFVLSVLQDR